MKSIISMMTELIHSMCPLNITPDSPQGPMMLTTLKYGKLHKLHFYVVFKHSICRMTFSH